MMGIIILCLSGSEVVSLPRGVGKTLLFTSKYMDFPERQEYPPSRPLRHCTTIYKLSTEKSSFFFVNG